MNMKKALRPVLLRSGGTMPRGCVGCDRLGYGDKPLACAAYHDQWRAWLMPGGCYARPERRDKDKRG